MTHISYLKEFTELVLNYDEKDLSSLSLEEQNKYLKEQIEKFINVFEASHDIVVITNSMREQPGFNEEDYIEQ